VRNPPYARLLPRAFKLFSIRSATKTLLPTVGFYVRDNRLPASDKPVLCTLNILPPMMTVWHHLARRNLGDDVDIVIFDSSGALDPREFPEARVVRFLNVYAATKNEVFLRHIAANRRTVWLCDDDVFILSGETLRIIRERLSSPRTASISFEPRKWWELEIEGTRYQPSGSYCLALNHGILRKEKLNLKPSGGNTHPTLIGKPPGRYDTFDRANEELIRRGYECAIVPEQERRNLIAYFTGLSGAVMLLRYFKTPEQTLDYYRTPPKRQWSGNMLFGTLAALLSVSAVQDCYATLKGKPYPLPSLPSRDELLKLYGENKRYLRCDQDMEKVLETGERLKKAL